LVRRNLRDDAVQLPYTRNVVTVDSKDNVILLQSGFLGGTVLNDPGDSYSPDLAKVITSHVVLVYVLSVDTKETITEKIERVSKGVIIWTRRWCGGFTRLSLCQGDSSAESNGNEETKYVLSFRR